jgi:iron complex transport system ATP-binding protein
MELEFNHITVAIKGKQILKDLSLHTTANKVVGIIGPNGSGKSTLIKTLFSITRYQEGDILLDGKDIKNIHKKDIARKVAYIGQETAANFDFSVREIVEMGRYPYESRDKNIKSIVNNALETLHIQHLLNRNIRTLSGGERKLVYLARAITQDTDIIILDEPTNHLDIKHQLMIMRFLKKSGKTIMIVIHDLYLAARFCDELYLVNDGTVFLYGKPDKVLTKENIREIFEVDGEVTVKNNELAFTLSYSL